MKMYHYPIPINPRIDVPQLRAELARRRISIAQFARVCGSHRETISYFLRDKRSVGQITRQKIAAAANEFNLVGVYSDQDDPLPLEGDGTTGKGPGAVSFIVVRH